MYELRIDQLDCLDAISLHRALGNKKALVVKATGLGKTLIGAKAIADWLRIESKPVLVLGHTDNVFYEFKKHLDKFLGYNGYTWGQYNGNMKEVGSYNILFGSFQTLREDIHYKKFRKNHFGLIVVDECHHAMARTYKRVLEYFTPNFLLGLTATPDRMDGRNIREIFGEEIYALSLPEALAQGGLLAKVKYKIFSDHIDNIKEIKHEAGHLPLSQLNRKFFIPERDEDIAKKIFDETKNDPQPRIVVFCPRINYAKQIAGVIHSFIPETEVLTSKLSRKVREPRLKKFRRGELKVLCVVDMLNEVIDVPEITHLVFLRSTQSYTILLQQLGRGLRLPLDNPNKVVKVLDFICSFERIKMIADIKNQVRGFTKEYDPFDVIIERNDFKELCKEVSEILKRANPVWTKQDVQEAIGRAIAAGYNQRFANHPWSMFRKKHPELLLPTHRVLKRFSKELELDVELLRSNYTKEQVALAIKVAKEAGYDRVLAEGPWTAFRKQNPELMLPVFAVIQRFSKDLKLDLIKLVEKKRYSVEEASAAIKIAQASGYNRTFSHHAWESFRIQHPELMLPTFRVINRYARQLGLELVKLGRRLSEDDVILAIKRAKKAGFTQTLQSTDWNKFRNEHPELLLPEFSSLKRFSKRLGLQIIKRRKSYSKEDVLKLVNAARDAGYDREFALDPWSKFKQKHPELGLPDFSLVKRFAEELELKIEVLGKKYTKEEVALAIKTAKAAGFDREFAAHPWYAFCKEHAELKLPNFSVIKRFAKGLGLQIVILEQRYTKEEVAAAIQIAFESGFKGKLIEGSWNSYRKNNLELALPYFSVIKRFARELKLKIYKGRSKKRYTQEQVFEAVKAAQNAGIVGDFSEYSWRKFLKQHSELELPSFGVLERHRPFLESHDIKFEN